MNRFVHHNLTRKWAIKEGYSELQAEKIARACWDFDWKKWFKPWAHFTICGAEIFSFLFFRLALAYRSERFLGYAIHTKQDAIGHGLIPPWQHRKLFPAIDSWQEISSAKKRKIEQATRQILKKAYPCFLIGE